MDTISMRGNLVADPSYRVTAGGLHMTRFRIAQNNRRFDRVRNEWVNGDPVYMSVICWRQLADNAAQTLHKGDTVLVQGRLTMHEWDDQNGVRRQSYEIDASAIGPDLSRYTAELGRPTREVEPQPLAAPAADGPGVPVQPTNPWTEPERAPAETAA